MAIVEREVLLNTVVSKVNSCIRRTLIPFRFHQKTLLTVTSPSCASVGSSFNRCIAVALTAFLLLFYFLNASFAAGFFGMTPDSPTLTPGAIAASNTHLKKKIL
ncbi:hypothetical protein, partial [Brucella pituitosa]|uniref:hypothetical protein n=1 Tax=Brucella pituitosa TaxID=571256 RepID=UPI001A96BF15